MIDKADESAGARLLTDILCEKTCGTAAHASWVFTDVRLHELLFLWEAAEGIGADAEELVALALAA